jgi:fructose-bisphosphate aldolase class I
MSIAAAAALSAGFGFRAPVTRLPAAALGSSKERRRDMTPELDTIARGIVADGKGILAADETVATIGKRLAAHDIESTAESRRDYREMFFSAPELSAFIGGIILQDETIRQQSSAGRPLVSLLVERGVTPGIKVDAGARPLAGAPGELCTEGLDGLRERLEEYHRLGARFAKWRAVIRIGEGRPTPSCVRANADALARYAALCQEQGLVPIVEPEVLMDGGHTIDRCEEVTGRVLQAVFDALYDQNVALEGILLKPNMVTAGRDCPWQATVEEVATATLRVLARHVPPAVPAVVFLSGGQSPVLATEHLSVINQLPAPRPWTLSFSYGRALQDEAMELWHGRRENVAAGQLAFTHRARCDSAAALGQYRREMEGAFVEGGALH